VPYSTVPAACSQLLATLRARPGLTGVLVEFGKPLDEPADRERVYIDDDVEVEREWAQTGQLRIDESYTLRVYVEVYQRGNDQETCWNRWWEILAEIEQAAVLDITLAGVLNWGAKPGRARSQTFPWADGWLSQGTTSLECSGRIQAS
jgi:hypothetical protein